MRSRSVFLAIWLVCVYALGGASTSALRQGIGKASSAYHIQLDRGHPWRPPFGLERIARPITIIVDSSARPEAGNYVLAALLMSQEVGRHAIKFPSDPPYSARVPLEGYADLLVLSRFSKPGEQPVEVARQAIQLPELEADAVARPDHVVNPVDLGTVLVPSGWLLLGPAQSATLEIAAISRMADLPGVQLKAWFDSAPTLVSTAALPLERGKCSRRTLKLPQPPADRDRDAISVVLENGGGRALWRKTIAVMMAQRPPPGTRFGATYEKLRYDAPISIREPGTGKFSSLRYEDGWSRELCDVVVWLPNGARFVFWRGSSYIPFWAGLHNTGFCYEWAEIISQPKGAVDCVEPLMDKELRYGRVEIVESSSARVHVRWSYQSTDFEYKVWGDAAVEDYYFYPDGFGTRVVNLKADPANEYELAEFIMLTPQGAYPLDVLSPDPVDALYLDGRSYQLKFPAVSSVEGQRREAVPGGGPAIYRARINKEETLAAVCFSPGESEQPPMVFAPFFDHGELVTPCYWGSHWPLARGNSTGRTIDDRIGFTPCHNSVMTWAGRRPKPLAMADVATIDTLGNARRMSLRRWAWLIGMIDEPDARLRDRARSLIAPPSLDLRGATLAFEGYALERRAIRLEATARDIQIMIKPSALCVNPVFELARAPRGEVRVTLAGKPLEPKRYAWDGQTLWLDATIERPTELRISFLGEKRGVR
jgi:hypothetical protein